MLKKAIDLFRPNAAAKRRAKRQRHKAEFAEMREQVRQSLDDLSAVQAQLGEFGERLAELRGQLPNADQVALIPTIHQQCASIESRLNGVQHGLGDIASRTFAFVANAERSIIAAEDQRRDILEQMIRPRHLPPLGWRIVTDHPVAWTSPDHLVPRGTRNDNSRHPRFVWRCEQMYPAPLRHLDIGCAGGGLVWDFTRRGHLSVGVEGSDYSLKEQRAEWRTVGDRLFTADVRFPFHFETGDGIQQRFDVISAWEVFEHIDEDAVDGLLENVRNNLAEGGVLVASVATFEDRDDATGTVWHVTVRPREWWLERLAAHGLQPVETPFETGDFVRGSGNLRAWDWDACSNPELGFHIVATLC